MIRRDPALATQFRRAIDADGSFKRAQQDRNPASYLRGLWQVWFAVRGRKAVKR